MDSACRREFVDDGLHHGARTVATMEMAEFLSAIRGLTLVERLEFGMDRDSAESTLTLRLVASTDAGARSVVVEFRDVSELRLKEFGLGWNQITWLEIEDVRAHQLDRIKYRVTDFEEDAISFSCCSFALKSRSGDDQSCQPRKT
jgi:hypothetical protein